MYGTRRRAGPHRYDTHEDILRPCIMRDLVALLLLTDTLHDVIPNKLLFCDNIGI